jgi:hypothetical protein
LLPAFKIEAAEVDPESFIPLILLQNTFRFWWFIFLLTIAGGVVGWFFHRMNPQVYEATARFSASIDFVSTGPMTQYEEDVALNAVGNLIFSDGVVEKVNAQLQGEGIALEYPDPRRSAVIERSVNVWVLRVRHSDPLIAERIANIWSDQGHAVLMDSYQHAIQAQQLGQYVQALENCLAKSSVSEPVHGFCNRYRFAEIQEDLHDAGRALYDERIASQELFSGLVLGSADKAVVSPAPVLYGRNQIILAGSLLGLILGVLLNQLNFPVRWFDRT